MTIEQTNVDILKGAYARWRADKEHGFQCWLDLVTPDIKWRSVTDGAPGMEFSACRTCPDDVRAYFEGLARDWQMIDYVTEEFIAQGDRVAMRGTCTWKNRQTGKVAHSPKADFFRMRDGKIAEFFEVFDSVSAFAATVEDKT